MLNYKQKLKSFARQLRSHSTDAEILLWAKLRRKQILNVQFYRQKPIGTYITDFYAPVVKLIIEVDGSQHFEACHIQKDNERDAFMKQKGLTVLRFDNLQVLQSIDEVTEVIFNVVRSRVKGR